MKDFLLLFKEPSQLYKKGRQNISITIPLILYFVLGFFSIFALYYGVESGPTVEVLKMTPSAMPFVLVSGFIGVVIGLLILVQIVYYVMILTCKIMEDVEFEKKQVKKLIYLAEILPSIPITVLQIIFMLVTKTEVPMVLSTICGVIASILTCLMIGYTMKVSMGTKKAHVAYPVLVFAVSIIMQVVSFITANHTLAGM